MSVSTMQPSTVQPSGKSGARVPPAGHTALQTLERDIHATGATDFFLFRRVAHLRFVHLGGVGRGKGWAGIVEIDLEADDRPARNLLLGRPVWFRHDEPRQIFGPYHAESAVAVRLSDDVIALLGANGDGARDFAVSDADVLAIATSAATLIEEVAPSKRLADELEMLHAVKAVADGSGGSVEDTLADVARVAAEALSCEVAIVWLPDGRLHVHQRDWSLPEAGAQLRTVLDELWSNREQLPRCRQDAVQTPLPFPLDPASGVRSFYTVAIGSPPTGLLVLIHSVLTPRGFTELCREIGVQLATTADTLLATALLREQLHAQVVRSSRMARTDCLTGVVNRLAWQELTAELQRDVDAGAEAGLLVIDLNELKRANDTLGHAFGDQLLETFARLITSNVRGCDVVARVGGDEFAVLLPSTDRGTTRQVAARVRAAVAGGAHLKGFPIAAAVGSSHCGRSQRIDEAIARADREMYRRKADMKQAAGEVPAAKH